MDMNDMDGIYTKIVINFILLFIFYKLNKTPLEINITKGYNLKSFSINYL